MKIGRKRAVRRAHDLLADAAIDPLAWASALEAVADACSARSGQLICTGGDGDIISNLLTGTFPGAAEVAEACGLADPVANPRLSAGLDAPAMTPVADQDYVDNDIRRRTAIYGEFFDPYDLWFNCQAVLLRRDDLLVRMSVTRTQREGALDEEALAAFRELMPLARAAIRLQSAVDAARTGGMIDSLNATAEAALLLDERGRLIDASHRGEAVLAEGCCLTLCDGRLAAVVAHEIAPFDALLDRALTAARLELPAASEPVLLRSQDGLTCVAVEVQPLPRSRGIFGGGAAVLVSLRPGMDDAGRAAILRHHFRLTAAEAEVALSLATGERASDIARRRNVALPTVRSQVKAVYAKLDVRRQSELAMRLQKLTAPG